MFTHYCNFSGDEARYLSRVYVPSFITDDIATELLVAADKYELDRLKIVHKVFIDKNPTTDNVTNILIFADAHSSTVLKKRLFSLSARI